ncbi:MAG: ABC transporter permease [Gemmatimonadota bacterium]
MLNGLWKLTWVETKVFVREPMGFVGSLAVPVILFVVLGRALGSRGGSTAAPAAVPFNAAILAAIFIAIGAVMSLTSIIAIYREGGILKRLRATPLSPLTILGAHVLVKLLFTVVGMALLVLAGRQFFPGAMQVNLFGFTAALLLSTLSILSLGFVLASIVRTARFAQPLGAAVLYPMLAVSGLFFPLEKLPPAIQIVAKAFPTTHAVSLMQGVWDGSGFAAHWGDVGALLLIFAVCSGVAAKVFRWE